MQRMLVGLVVVLTAAVGALAIATLHLYTEQGGRPARQPALQAQPVRAPEDAERLERFESEIRAVLAENRGLRRKLADLEGQLAALRARGLPGSDGEEAAPPAPAGAYGTPGEPHPRAPDGSFLITEEDEAFYLAVQERIRTKQRIDAATRGVMRRLDRLAENGEIGAITEEERTQVEGIVRRFVIERDNMVNRYLRSPDENVKSLELSARRDQMRTEQDALVAEVERELVPLLGPKDAARVAEGALATTWGLRRSPRARGRFDRER